MAGAERPTGVAVIFAGGVGARMDHVDNLPKQFIEVRGKPILVYTLEHFQNHPEIDAIYFVSLADYIPHVEELVAKFGIDKVRAIVPGGDSAHASIANGLKRAVADGHPRDAVVLIHDGVRPIINGKLISDNIASVLQHVNGITSIPAFETVAKAWEGTAIVEEVTDRNKMHVLQAPQSFRLGDVHDVNIPAEVDALVGRFVDQAHLMHHYGRRLHMVSGLRGNVKITVPLDAVFFTFLVESGEHERIARGEGG